MINLVAIESQVVARLKAAEWPEVKAIYTTAELAGLRQREQPAPALHVIYDGFDIKEQSGPLNYQVAVRLYVIAVVANVQGQTWMSADGGRLMMLAAERLVGWAPDDFCPLQMVESPRPFYRQEYGYFPLLFLSQINLKFPRQT